MAYMSDRRSKPVVTRSVENQPFFVYYVPGVLIRSMSAIRGEAEAARGVPAFVRFRPLGNVNSRPSKDFRRCRHRDERVWTMLVPPQRRPNATFGAYLNAPRVSNF